MTKKLIKVNDTKAYRVEAIEIDGVNYVSVRQLYKTKKDPDNWQIGRQGVTLPVEDLVAERVIKAARKMATDPDTEFKKLNLSKD